MGAQYAAPAPIQPRPDRAVCSVFTDPVVHSSELMVG
ncbi:hypothetical protein Ae406Ps2_1755c [Pseudonocardia sp. Ae406_Ps2]|nr:hypothetical protein Ae406Ps2_1755c [Pseudonocardia sp. Ae406_Ps2]OLM23325.1 hypothetical protein Ae706Ps2_1758c [Pseudonocardia sp. Ae706_Ps2]